MGRYLTIFVIVFLTLTSGWAKDKDKKFSLELYGGLSIFSQKDVNLHKSYTENYYNNYLDGQYKMKDDYYGPYHRTDIKRNSFLNIPGIKNGVPLGFNIRYKVSERFSVSLGMRYVMRQTGMGKTPHTQEYSANNIFRGNVVNKYSISEYKNSLEMFIPNVGFKWDFLKKRGFSLSFIGNIGYIRAKFKNSYKGSRSQHIDGRFAHGFNDQYEMEGTGNGLMLEGGIRMEADILKNTSLFFETGYSYKKIFSVSGSETFKTDILQAGGSSYSSSYTTKGDWRVIDGLDGYKGVDVYERDNGFKKFAAKLSGIFFRVGVKFRF